MLALAPLLGALVQRFGQPSVSGEIAAGVVLGPTAAALVRQFATAPDFWRLLRHAVLLEATLDYRRVECRVIRQGTHDLLAASQSAWLAALVPGARFELLPVAGHSSIADVPHPVIALVVGAVDAAAR